MTPVIGIGAGGHAKVVLEAIRRQGLYEVVGLLDEAASKVGGEVLGVPVIGDDAALERVRASGVRHAFVGVGSTGDSTRRIEVHERTTREGMEIISVVDPTAFVSPSARLGAGSTVLACAIVQAGAEIGRFALVNSGAIVEHDCLIGEYVHVATGARLASTVHCGRGAHIGVGASIRQCVSVGERAGIGAGAVVVRDVGPGEVVVGNPARLLRRLPA